VGRHFQHLGVPMLQRSFMWPCKKRADEGECVRRSNGPQQSRLIFRGKSRKILLRPRKSDALQFGGRLPGSVCGGRRDPAASRAGRYGASAVCAAWSSTRAPRGVPPMQRRLRSL